MSRDSPTLDDLYGIGAEAGDDVLGFRTAILDEFLAERERQISACRHGGDTDEFDRGNSRNDWLAYINAYTGRAAQKVFRNEKEGQEFRPNMIKAAALILAAIEAHDRRYC